MVSAVVRSGAWPRSIRAEATTAVQPLAKESDLDAVRTELEDAGILCAPYELEKLCGSKQGHQAECFQCLKDHKQTLEQNGCREIPSHSWCVQPAPEPEPEPGSWAWGPGLDVEDDTLCVQRRHL